MDLQHLSISRAVLFDILPDKQDRTPSDPIGGTALSSLPNSAKLMVASRIAGALGKNANGLEVSIIDTSPSSFFQTACKAIDSSNENFLILTREIAVMLAAAQSNKHLAQSKLMLIQATVTAGQLPCLIAVKAELQDGLADRPAPVEGQMHLQHLKDIFMTDSQRLFKIGYLQRTAANATINQGQYDPNDHIMHLFDHLMSSTETRNAAFYFYNSFLGCNTASSARARTRDFFENTMAFIKASGLPEDGKLDLIEALRTELRSTANVINIVDFASEHMTPKVKQAYEGFMIEQKGFPNHAVEKDTFYVNAKLRRRRKITFSNDIWLSTPPELMSSISTVENDDGSTTVTVPGLVEKRE
jgi:hypothetical protein